MAGCYHVRKKRFQLDNKQTEREADQARRSSAADGQARTELCGRGGKRLMASLAGSLMSLERAKGRSGDSLSN
ncbi:hypothetical protein JOB18_000121 [Solea senegalensis]|uniref:Uncharacterized protein n=1 Tax=Solea senegalensis TaxID=28829 RepID=A0AAV6PEA3_SOLSE|nr:hypothetical protein JOB18_000121 [Solea senegalensis]